MERDCFTFFRSYFDAANRIRNKSARLALYESIAKFALDGIPPDIDSLPDVAAIAYELIEPVIKSGNRKSEAGRKGGRARGKQAASNNEAGSKQTESDIDIENENETMNNDYNDTEVEDDVTQTPIIVLPLIGGSEYCVTEDDVAEYRNLYPYIDIELQLRKMRAWLIANPEKGKTRSNIKGFIYSWIANENKANQINHNSPTSGNIFASLAKELES